MMSLNSATQVQVHTGIDNKRWSVNFTIYDDQIETYYL